MFQDMTVYLIISLTISYVISSLVKNLRTQKTKSGCGGCTGCDLANNRSINKCTQKCD